MSLQGQHSFPQRRTYGPGFVTEAWGFHPGLKGEVMGESQRYTPEMGQAIFGQPFQEFEVPDIMDAVLCAIRDEYDIAYWNAKQEKCPSPFSNSGAKLNTPTFKAHAYSWGDEGQPFNFAWRNLRISWYKYLGRGMSANMSITPAMAAECLGECLAEIRKMHHEEWPDDGDSTHPHFIDLEW